MDLVPSSLKSLAVTSRRLNVISGLAPSSYVREMIRCAALLLCMALPAHATSQDEILDAAILPGWRAADGSHVAALRLTLAPGWKTYWRSPGDSGIPPLFDWTGSRNIDAVSFHWPVPDVFHVNGMQSIGYHDQLILPFEIRTNDPGQPIEVTLRVDLGICRDICVPAQVDLSATLAVPGAPDAAIDAALGDRPTTAAAAGLTAIRCAVDPIADGLRLMAEIDLPRQGTEEVVVFEAGQPDIWVAEAVQHRSGDRLTATTEMVAPSGAPFMLDRSAVRVTVLSPGKAVEIRGCPAD